MDFDIMKYYTSFSSSYREEEQIIISKSIEMGIVPHSARYEEINGAIHGVIQSSQDQLYYFNLFGDSFKVLKADDPTKVYDAGKILKKSNNGFDLVKGPTGAGSSGEVKPGIPTMEEEDSVAQQNDLITDQHPGAAIGTTPDRPEVGRQWHQEDQPIIGRSLDAINMLNTANETIRKSIDLVSRPISDKEKQFMLEVLGRTPDQVTRGEVYMNPTQKVLYQRWLNKSMETKVYSLTDWLKKNG